MAMLDCTDFSSKHSLRTCAQVRPNVKKSHESPFSSSLLQGSDFCSSAAPVYAPCLEQRQNCGRRTHGWALPGVVRLTDCGLKLVGHELANFLTRTSSDHVALSGNGSEVFLKDSFLAKGFFFY